MTANTTTLKRNKDLNVWAVPIFIVGGLVFWLVLGFLLGLGR